MNNFLILKKLNIPAYVKNELFWEIPDSVDLEGFLKKRPPAFQYKIDKFYYIIDYLSRGMDLEDLDNNEGFVNLNAKTLQKVIHDYKLYIDHLLKNRFIRTDKKYIVGEKSFGYQINKYKNYHATVKKIPIKDFPLIKRKRREIVEHQNKINTTKKQYPHLTKWFNSNLQMDVNAAKLKVEELFPEQTGPIRGTRKGKPSDWNRRYKAIYSIEKFARQEFYYGVDDNVGRFHSNLTNIKRELRNFITYDGQRLVNVDIKNAQPLLSTILLDKDFYNNKGKTINIFNIPSSLQLLSINNSHSYMVIIIMIVKTLERFNIQQVEEYIAMVNSGEFYKQISEIMFPEDEFNKQKMKETIFTIFFSHNRFMGQPGAKAKRQFAKLFPDVYSIFKLIKRNNHTALAHILQKIESEIIIQKVALRISNERPALPIFTVHDSVATTVGNEKYVISVIEEEVLKLTGLNARLGKEYWEEQ